MPRLIEYKMALSGLLRLLAFKTSGFRYFDLSLEGAKRSFGIALLIYPYYLIQIIGPDPLPPAVSWTRYIFSLSIGYVLLWTAFPLILLNIARLSPLHEKATATLCLYNWLNLASLALHLPSDFLYFSGRYENVATFFNYLVFAYLTGVLAFIFRSLLTISWAWVVALVLLEVFLTQFLILPVSFYIGTQ